MIKVVMDTSSIVSLEMIKILENCLKITKIYISDSVKKEIEEISKYTDKEGKSALRTLDRIKSDEITITKIKDIKKVNDLLSSDVNEGEASCIVLCLEQNIKTLIMDDVDAGYRLEGIAIANDIKIKLSVALIIELIKQRILSKADAISYIKKLIKIREWEGGVLEVLLKEYLE